MSAMKHGHVTPNTDGSKARCGGPKMCAVCAKELAEFSMNETPTEPKHVVYCINSSAEGMGSHVNSRESALQWFAAYLENLSDGDDDEITIRRKDMTKAEFEAIPEQ
jgi:hypothetical protein